MAEHELQAPGAPKSSVNFPEGFMPLYFDGFDGMNTKASRPAIKDQEMAYCSNWLPLGPNNLRTLYDLGVPIYTAQSGTSISTYFFGNIADTSIAAVFQGDGSIVQVNTTTLATFSMAPKGTIVSPTNQMGAGQWGSQYTLYCAPQANGYFIWDGTLLYKAGTLGPSVTIANGGAAYTSLPTITPIGGAGTGATFASTINSQGNVSTITVTNQGTGYTANDVVTLAFSGGGSKTTAVAAVGISSQQVTGLLFSNSGTGYTGTTTVAIQGGGGIGATAKVTVDVSGGGIIILQSITNVGQGYTSAPTAVFTDPNNPVAAATVNIMPFGIQGTTLETYTSRVWVGNGAAPVTPPPKSRVQFGAAGNPADFNTGDGAGAFLSTDSFLRVGYHSLKQANGFLYELGDSSINYISGVVTAGNPAITTFSNQNVDPQVGTPWADTVQVYSRAIVFANTYGVHALYGGAVQKVSDALDGIFTTVPAVGGGGKGPTVGGIVPSGAVHIVFGIHIYCLLLPIIDPFTQAQTNTLCCWDGKKWFLYQPSKSLTFVNSQEINSVLTAYGMDGHAIYPLFNTASTAINKVVQSKLWRDPTYLTEKKSQSLFGVLKSNDNNASSLTFNVDTELGSSASVTVANGFAATWTATGGLAVNWTATGGLAVTWQATGTSSFGPLGVTGDGSLMGLTAQTTATDLTLISLGLVAQQYGVRQ